MEPALIEGCVDSYASAMAACRGGADRLELCANLAIGGTTPSPSLFRQVRRDCQVPIHVLIRPRFGDFLYSGPEREEICGEIRRFRDLGADGVVIGALTPEAELDREALLPMTDCAGGMSLTLHRAFDMTRDAAQALEAAVELGFRTVLTSGQAGSAAEGKEALGQLRRRAAGRIAVMAGCGVRAENIEEIYRAGGVRAFHTTGRKGPVDSGMRWRRAGVSMGLPSLSEYELWLTDEETFRACARIVHSLPAPEEGAK